MPPECVLGSHASWGHPSVENALFMASMLSCNACPHHRSPHTLSFPAQPSHPSLQGQEMHPSKGKSWSPLEWASLVAQIVRIFPQCRRPRFNPWVGRSPGERNSNPLQYSWRIPWTEEPGGLLYPRGCKESDTTERLTLSLSLSSTGLLRLLRHTGADWPGQRAWERRNRRTH